MNILLNKLIDLKENHNAKGIKAEFESEGATFEEIMQLKQLATKASLELVVKIGGCGALKDMQDTKTIGVNTIVAPMIESEYALQKFVETYQEVYTNEHTKLYINIETITGYNNIDNILSSKYLNYITGIIWGRGDMAKSMNIIDVEDTKLTEIGKNLSKKVTSHNKEFIIGGKITTKSLQSFNKINFSQVETRKIIFDKNINSNGINKAIKFEIDWIKAKKSFKESDKLRLEQLEKRYEHV